MNRKSSIYVIIRNAYDEGVISITITNIYCWCKIFIVVNWRFTMCSLGILYLHIISVLQLSVDYRLFQILFGNLIFFGVFKVFQ